MSVQFATEMINHYLTKRRSQRGGFILLVVLLTVVGAMALGYSALCVMSVHYRIVRNGQLRAKAETAAESGLSIAFAKMFSSSWPGVGTVVAGSCAPNEAFEVTYLAGDATLQAADPDYVRYPYRVTLKAKGSAWLPGESNYPSVCEKTWVVELVPRALAPEPSDWNTIQKYTIYQTGYDINRFNIPCQIDGPVRFQAVVRIAPDYPSNNPRYQYLSDLYAMKQAGYPDYRPFTGIVRWPGYLQTLADLNARLWLGVSVISVVPQYPGGDLQSPATLNQYRVYPGGPVYTVPQLPDILAGVTMVPDPLTNPCGLYFRSGNLTLQDNVQWTGTVIVTGDVILSGSNVSLRAVSMPPVSNKQGAVELPVLVCKNLRVEPGTRRQIEGLVGAFGEVQIKKASDTTDVQFLGKVFATRFRIDPRTPWDSVDWDKKLSDFQKQKPNATGDNKYFPLWLRQFGLDPAPKVRFTDRTPVITYHWKDATNTVYAPAPQDYTAIESTPGLRWKIVNVVED
ncbi:hypothetical protein [Thermogutta sp.]|uniref:hypothetical protein n=1 Tax=Thermogutta sp. TaxID=1962930 RepID=UPI003C7D2B23